MNPLPSLPIDDVLPDIVEAVRRCGRAVIRAPTGAGKTSRIPPALLDAEVGHGQIVLLQPRRLAARAAARRMAAERGGRLGDEVGYQVRFDSQHGPQTKILVVTEGVLLRRLQFDPFLEGVGTLIFDEFHERNLDSDLALGMAWRIRQTVRPDLRIVVMSATLDPGPLAAWLDDAPQVESLGRTWPVQIEYLPSPTRRPVLDRVVDAVGPMLSRTEGHLLVFLPGVGEIRQAARGLTQLADRQGFELHMLFGDLPPEEQDRVLAPTERRKLVLATNVAETSVTIDGVTAVVDSGLARVRRLDPRTGLDRLSLESISQASADQRAGRAGRTRPGICLRLWDEAAQRRLPPRTDPEIHRVELSSAVLQLKCWGERNAAGFPWYEPPASHTLERAERLLQRLGALDEQGEVTEQGRQMAQLPLQPRLARLVLEGDRLGILHEAAWLAALLSERDPFLRHGSASTGGAPRTRSAHRSRSDVIDRLSALQEAERSGTTTFPWGDLHRGGAATIARVRDQIERHVRELPRSSAVDRPSPEEEALLRCIACAFPDRLARRRDRGSDRGVMVGGGGVQLAPQSSVREAPLFVCVEIDAGATDAVVRQASAVEMEWLSKDQLRSVLELFFHPSQKQVQARQRTYYEDLLLAETTAPLPDAEDVSAVLFPEATRNWQQVFPDIEDVQFYLARVQSLRSWMPELELPSFDREMLEEILERLCHGCRSFAELRRADWLSEMRNRLTWQQQQQVDELAPAQWKAPSGRRIRLQYAEGQAPIVAVKIQEVFGLPETPRIAGGRIRVQMHLLAPSQRTQQITEDLASFWKNTYPSVRKELARRYPRHAWPEDPLSAVPGGK